MLWIRVAAHAMGEAEKCGGIARFPLLYNPTGSRLFGEGRTLLTVWVVARSSLLSSLRPAAIVISQGLKGSKRAARHTTGFLNLWAHRLR